MLKSTTQRPKASQIDALTPLQADLAALLADMLVLDLQRERLVSQGEPTVNEVNH
jgi:hypothetical protein